MPPDDIFAPWRARAPRYASATEAIPPDSSWGFYLIGGKTPGYLLGARF
ncbi:MAG: hypothetical protein H0W86_07850 [Armatimonadetes bacterium]|nr:hypothetical protein [Armatimonadota bacterium]